MGAFSFLRLFFLQWAEGWGLQSRGVVWELLSRGVGWDLLSRGDGVGSAVSRVRVQSAVSQRGLLSRGVGWGLQSRG